jgi:hypothetical protein
MAADPADAGVVIPNARADAGVLMVDDLRRQPVGATEPSQ